MKLLFESRKILYTDLIANRTHKIKKLNPIVIISITYDYFKT